MNPIPLVSRTTYWVCFGIFLFHIIISHVGLPYIKRADVYPFYDWNLFSFSPVMQRKVIVRVLEVNGKKNDPIHVEFQHRNIYPGRLGSFIPYQVNRLGYYLSANKELGQKGESYKKEMEYNLFFGYQTAKYEVGIALVNIRDLLKTGQIENYHPLGQFEFHMGNHEKF